MRDVVLDIGFSPGDIVVFTGAVRDLHLAHPEFRIRVQTCCPAIFEHNPHVVHDNAPQARPYRTLVMQATNLQKRGYDPSAGTAALFSKILAEHKVVALHNEATSQWEYYERGRERDSAALLFTADPTSEAPSETPLAHRVQYNDIHNCGWSGRHFSTAFHMDLETNLGVSVPQTTLLPDLHLSDEERGWASQVEDTFGYRGPFWLINAGHKSDYPLKQWGFENWQRLVDILADRIQFVQVGELSSPEALEAHHKGKGGQIVHEHPELRGVLDLRGKTDLRQLIRLTYHAQGAVCGVTCLAHMMAAWRKPCVTIAGGREPRRWESYPMHRYMDTLGQLPCCDYDGCWLDGQMKGKENKLCKRMAGGRPLCMRMITPERVADEVMGYYRGGVL